MGGVNMRRQILSTLLCLSKTLAVRMPSGAADGGDHADDVRGAQPGEGVLQVDGDALAEAGGQAQQAALALRSMASARRPAR
jgi:hypothetical protein